ncbi:MULTISPECIES: siderophore-interacting protein [unclassified Paludibacterium]|uniref:siderophore-interacting protein n=1 Tax=unclassified Paludibacterium TaxID=2618429 RepID=UPI001C03C434|nr:siderophore-interacting protein [Paludibacterium sp. B53371]BEV72697.1 siderophore-interacting protein [Paludibacterium sp. THUN1379]
MREDLQIHRVRHPLRLRLAQVVAIHPRGEHRVRVTFRGPELIGFDSPGFDDHVKVFFPAPGETLPRLPSLDADGQPLRVAGAERPIARDYTPRRFNAERGELEIEFVLHGAGPATRWAAQARIGQTLGFGGPRGSMLIPPHFDWHWLIGDSSAMPAISRRLEDLPAQARVDVVLMVEPPVKPLVLPSVAQVTQHWLAGVDHATDDSPLQQLLRRLPLPPGEGFIWVAGELATVRATRQTLLARGIDKQRIRASSYWQHGTEASHETLSD